MSLFRINGGVKAEVNKLEILVNFLPTVLNGKTTHENNTKRSPYNLGWRQNLLEVLGDNWRRAVIWPFVTSKLPHDGVNWDTTETWRLEGPKSR